MKLAITPCDARRRICRACPPNRMPEINTLVSHTTFTMKSVYACGYSGFLPPHLVRSAYCDSILHRRGRKHDPTAAVAERKSGTPHVTDQTVCVTLALPLRQFQPTGCPERICLRLRYPLITDRKGIVLPMPVAYPEHFILDLFP